MWGQNCNNNYINFDEYSLAQSGTGNFNWFHQDYQAYGDRWNFVNQLVGQYSSRQYNAKYDGQNRNDFRQTYNSTSYRHQNQRGTSNWYQNQRGNKRKRAGNSPSRNKPSNVRPAAMSKSTEGANKKARVETSSNVTSNPLPPPIAPSRSLPSQISKEKTTVPVNSSKPTNKPTQVPISKAVPIKSEHNHCTPIENVSKPISNLVNPNPVNLENAGCISTPTSNSVNLTSADDPECVSGTTFDSSNPNPADNPANPKNVHDSVSPDDDDVIFIPTVNEVIEISESPRRVKSYIKHNFEPIKVIILPKYYPATLLSLKDLNLIQDIISQELDQAPMMPLCKIQFMGVQYQPSMLIMECVTGKTVEWVNKIVPTLAKWKGAKLMTRREYDIPETKYLTILFPMCSGSSPFKILNAINKQNEELKTHLWKVLQSRDEGSGRLMRVDVDDYSRQSLKKMGGFIFFRLGLLPVHGLQNCLWRENCFSSSTNFGNSC